MRVVIPTLLLVTILTQTDTSIHQPPPLKAQNEGSELRRTKRFIGTEDIISVVGTILELWDLIDTRLANNDVNFPNFTNFSVDLSFLNRKQAQLTERIVGISQQLDNMEANLAYSVDYTINSILTAMPTVVRNELRLHDLKNVINQLYLQDRELQRYLTNQSAIERFTLQDWALAVSSHHKDSVRNLMARLHAYVSPTAGDPYQTSVFHLIRQAGGSESICELQQSEQELIYNMYNMITLADLKGYTMLQFSWMLLNIYDKGNFTREAEIMRKLYMERTQEKQLAAKAAMIGADRSLYRCDPPVWIEGENYVKLTKLIQGYIENEVNLNPYGTCGQNCKYYEVAQYQGCFKEQFCAKQRPCHGRVHHCTYYDSDMNICKSSSNDRRYDWIEYENGKIFGNKGTCPNRNLHKVDSWWRYLFWHCSYCFCLCDDKHPSSDRYFSLREVTSDVANNKVITGVRLVKDNQIIHIQIQQGRLEARGVINKTTTEWVPVESFRVMDDDAMDGVDYHTLTWEQRGVDLDDAVAPSTHILTGARFRRVGNHLNLEISATSFDFETGILHPTVERLWIANDNTDASFDDPRTEVHLRDPDLPTRSRRHLPDSKHDQFILFRESSITKDAAQSTVPYLDAQTVEANGMLLSGLGIHHRGSINSGGFLALKVITYDYSPNIVTPTKEIA